MTQTSHKWRIISMATDDITSSQRCPCDSDSQFMYLYCSLWLWCLLQQKTNLWICSWCPWVGIWKFVVYTWLALTFKLIWQEFLGKEKCQIHAMNIAIIGLARNNQGIFDKIIILIVHLSHLRGDWTFSHFLTEESVLNIRETRSIFLPRITLYWQEQVP